MKLRINTPREKISDIDIKKLTAKGFEGIFTILSKHIDYITCLRNGIVSYLDNEDNLKYIAVTDGILTKVGNIITISSLVAIPGDSLEELKNIKLEEYIYTEELEKEVKVALANMEYNLLREVSGFKGVYDKIK